VRCVDSTAAAAAARGRVAAFTSFGRVFVATEQGLDLADAAIGDTRRERRPPSKPNRAFHRLLLLQPTDAIVAPAGGNAVVRPPARRSDERLPANAALARQLPKIPAQSGWIRA